MTVHPDKRIAFLFDGPNFHSAEGPIPAPAGPPRPPRPRRRLNRRRFVSILPPDRSGGSSAGLLAVAIHVGKERAIPGQSTVEPGAAATVPAEAPRFGVLPSFVTAEWLRANHHLMKADRRRLAAAMAEEYADWPAAADGADEAAFWEAVHGLAGRWSWFLWLFEERIGTLFGSVKGPRKQLVPRLLLSAADRARALRPVARGGAEPDLLGELETLWRAGEHGRLAEAVWALSCLGDVDSRFAVAPWLAEPEIGMLVGDAVGRARLDADPRRGDLAERLLHEAAGPHLERLVGRADAEYAALETEIAGGWDRLARHVSEHDAYGPAADMLSYLALDLETLAMELAEIGDARGEALARCRHAALGAALGEAVDAMRDTGLAGEAGGLRGRVAALLGENGLPLRFPDPEWERCEALAGRFRAAAAEPAAAELALREASRRYAEDPSPENLDGLQAAAAAERENPRSAEPARAALDEIAACLGGLVERFGALAERAAPDDPPGPSEPDDPERALRAEVGELRAAQRAAGERIAELERALAEAGGENDALREERHRLNRRIAALEGAAGEPADAAKEEAVPERYADLPRWTAETFEGRVALPPRALRALKGAAFEDVALVGRAIALLGGPYWRMKTGAGSRAAFDDALRDLRLRETPSASRDRQARARDDFTVEWEGRRLALDRHLKNKAGTRDPRRCFRLYFAWDDATRQVVIGHLPGHLRTTDT